MGTGRSGRFAASFGFKRCPDFKCESSQVLPEALSASTIEAMLSHKARPRIQVYLHLQRLASKRSRMSLQRFHAELESLKSFNLNDHAANREERIWTLKSPFIPGQRLQCFEVQQERGNVVVKREVFVHKLYDEHVPFQK